jgi:hypothetical protein
MYRYNLDPDSDPHGSAFIFRAGSGSSFLGIKSMRIRNTGSYYTSSEFSSISVICSQNVFESHIFICNTVSSDRILKIFLKYVNE